MSTVKQKETNSVCAKSCPLCVIDRIEGCSINTKPPNATECIKQICLWALSHTWLMVFLIDEPTKNYLP